MSRSTVDSLARQVHDHIGAIEDGYPILRALPGPNAPTPNHGPVEARRELRQ
ncbi:MAG: hypothetical protein WD064_02240 [Acidimicrobiia bacterium]